MVNPEITNVVILNLTNIRVLEIFQQGHLPDCRARCAFLVLQPNFLQRHQVFRQPRFSFEDRCVSALERHPEQGTVD